MTCSQKYSTLQESECFGSKISDRLIGDRFSENGFGQSRTVLDQEIVDSLNGELDCFLSRASLGRRGNQIVSRFGEHESERGWKINNLWETCSGFLSVAIRPDILSEIARITGARTIRLWRDQLLVKAPGPRSDVKWHQDAFWWSVLSPATQVTAWIALDRVSVENGCMLMAAKSHRCGLQTNLINAVNSGRVALGDINERYSLTDVKLPCGGIHYHHCLTWHASHPNLSASTRRAYAIHYMIDDTYITPNSRHPIADALTVDADGRLCGEAFPLLWSSDKR